MPEAQRSPEVQAFIDGVALLRQVGWFARGVVGRVGSQAATNAGCCPPLRRTCGGRRCRATWLHAHAPYPAPGQPQIPALLPRTANGRALLSVETEAGEQRALQAMLHWIAADAASPEPPACDVDVTKHLIDYHNAMAAAMRRGWQPRWAALVDAVDGYVSSMFEGRPERMADSVERRCAVLRLLSDQRSAAEATRQLAEVAAAAAAGEHPPAAPLPSLEQLRFACHHGVVKTGTMLLRFVAMQQASEASPEAARLAAQAQLPPLPRVAPQRAAAIAEQVAASGEALLRLQPDSPKSWAQAGVAAGLQGRDALSVERLLRGADLAKQQGADVGFATCASLAAMDAFDPDTRSRLPASLVARATAAAAEFEAALKRAARVLPAPWVQPLEPGVQMVKLKLAALGGQPADPDSLANPVHAMRATVQAAHCTGCRKRSMGLRRCSRCQVAFYCRWAPLGLLRLLVLGRGGC